MLVHVFSPFESASMWQSGVLHFCSGVTILDTFELLIEASKGLVLKVLCCVF